MSRCWCIIVMLSIQNPLWLQNLCEHVKSGHKCLFNKYWCLLKQKFTSANTVSSALLPISRFVLHLCICRFILFRQSKLSWGWGVIVAFLDILFIFPLAETQYISERRVPCMIFQSDWCFCFLSDVTQTFSATYNLFILLERLVLCLTFLQRVQRSGLTTERHVWNLFLRI